ncbi:MAG: thioredoxin [Syntrophomonadaceae bacterium]|nr:thioredoxin [Syntrophomonadaceae bacterium]
MVKYTVEVSEQTFNQEVLEQQQPVLVDFWAAWCGPCQMIAPVVEDLAEEYKDRVKVVKVNVDQNRQLAVQFGVMSIPTLVLFKNGQEVDRLVGFMGKEQLKEKINQHLV